jgi:glycosyltransferase involved in cell wall biosynthesis
VITTCTDLGLFKLRERKPSAGPGARGFRMGYVGAVGLWYLFDEALDCFGRLREIEPRARLVILNRGEHAYILERLAHHRVPHECVELRAVEPEEVPAEMSAMDAGMFFLKPAHSKIASVPTKLGEFLACGVPCLSNTGVGDVASVLEGEGVGVSVRDFRRESLREGLHRLLVLVRDPETPRRCREAAERHFALEGGVRAYARIYEELGRESSGGGERSKDRVQPRG